MIDAAPDPGAGVAGADPTQPDRATAAPNP